MSNLDLNDEIAVLILQHGKVNTLDVDMLTELISCIDQLETSEAKAAIITGAGNVFSAGVDLFKVVNGGKVYLDVFLPKLTESLLRLFTCPKPLVAAVNGHAIAGGAILTWCCDHRIMAGGTGRIGVPELLVGVPFPSLPLEIVRFAIPPQHFQTVVYTGKTYLADEALALGLIDESVQSQDLFARAQKAAAQFAAIPPKSFSLTKKLMRQPVLDNYQKYKETLDLEVAKVWESPQVFENIRNYLERTVGKK